MKNNETENEPSQGQESLANLEKALIHFVESFESSAERWEKNVYPFIKSFESA
ncbi:hypothetical protein THIOM_000239, partial [Candidatus Thiomargarita nelsonii]